MMPSGVNFSESMMKMNSSAGRPASLLDLRRDSVDSAWSPVHRAEDVFELHAGGSANLHQPVELAVALMEDALHRRLGNTHALGKSAIGDALRLQRPLQRLEDQAVHEMRLFSAGSYR